MVNAPGNASISAAGRAPQARQLRMRKPVNAALATLLRIGCVLFTSNYDLLALLQLRAAYPEPAKTIYFRRPSPLELKGSSFSKRGEKENANQK
jgi:hypothetical protein